MAKIINLKNINKKYKNKVEEIEILKDMNLEINSGELISIIGKSGSGKTTLLNILGLLDDFDSGEYFIEGEIIPKNDSIISKTRNEKIGYIFQFHHLLKEFTAIENVMIPGFINNKENLEKRAMELLKIVGLENRIYHKPDELSGGEKQRVSIARALINSPKLVLADEPTGNLDIETSKLIDNLFYKINKELNQTIVIVTHNLELAKIADKIYELKNGKLELKNE